MHKFWTIAPLCIRTLRVKAASKDTDAPLGQCGPNYDSKHLQSMMSLVGIKYHFWKAAAISSYC